MGGETDGVDPVEFWSFLQEDDAERLERLFWSHVTLGQAALARGALRALKAEHTARQHSEHIFPSADPRVRSLLDELLGKRFAALAGGNTGMVSGLSSHGAGATGSVSNGDPGAAEFSDSLFVQTEAVPTPAHLLWLAADMYAELLDDAEPTGDGGDNRNRGAEPSREVCAQIFRAYIGDAQPASMPSESALSQSVSKAAMQMLSHRLPRGNNTAVSSVTYDDILGRPRAVAKAIQELNGGHKEKIQSDFFSTTFAPLVEFDILLHMLFGTSENGGSSHQIGSSSRGGSNRIVRRPGPPLQLFSELQVYRRDVLVFGQSKLDGRLSSEEEEEGPGAPPLSEFALQQVSQVLLEQPAVAKHLLWHLCSFDAPFLESTRSLVLACIRAVESLVSEGNLQQAYALVRCVPLPTFPLQKEQKIFVEDESLDRSWRGMLQLLVETGAGNNDAASSSVFEGYSSLFQRGLDHMLRTGISDDIPLEGDLSRGTPTLGDGVLRSATAPVRALLHVESDVIKDANQTGLYERLFGETSTSVESVSSQSSGVDWNEFFLHVLSSKVHFVDVLHEQGEAAVLSHAARSAIAWVNVVPELKGLMILSLWDGHKDDLLQERELAESLLQSISDDQASLDSFWTTSNSGLEGSLGTAVDSAAANLSFRVITAWWCADRLRGPNVPSVGEIFEGLESHSLPFLLRNDLADTSLSDPLTIAHFESLSRLLPADSQHGGSGALSPLPLLGDVDFLRCYFALATLIQSARNLARTRFGGMDGNFESLTVEAIAAVKFAGSQIRMLLTRSTASRLVFASEAMELVLMTPLLSAHDLIGTETGSFVAPHSVVVATITEVRASLPLILKDAMSMPASLAICKRVSGVLTNLEWKHRILTELASTEVQGSSVSSATTSRSVQWLSEVLRSGEYVSLLRASPASLAHFCLRMARPDLAAELVASSSPEPADLSAEQRRSVNFAVRLDDSSQSRLKLDEVVDQIATSGNAKAAYSAFIVASDLAVASHDARDCAHFSARAVSLLAESEKSQADSTQTRRGHGRQFKTLSQQAAASGSSGEPLWKSLSAVDSSAVSTSSHDHRASVDSTEEEADSSECSAELHSALANAYASIAQRAPDGRLTVEDCSKAMESVSRVRTSIRRRSRTPEDEAMPFNFFEGTIQYLLRLQTVVKLDGVASSELLPYLRHGAGYWLRTLVFEQKQFDAAQDLASEYGLDLMAIILRGLDQDDGGTEVLTLPVLRFIFKTDAVAGVLATMMGLRPVYADSNDPRHVQVAQAQNRALLEFAVSNAPPLLEPLVRWVSQKYSDFCHCVLAMPCELPTEGPLKYEPVYSVYRALDGNSEMALDSISAEDAAQWHLRQQGEAAMLTLLKSGSPADDARLYNRFVEELVRQRRFQEALAMIDKPHAPQQWPSVGAHHTLEDVVVQHLFGEVVSATVVEVGSSSGNITSLTPSEEQDWWHTLLPRVPDAASYAPELLRRVRRWPNIHICIELVDFCRCHLQESPSDGELETLLELQALLPSLRLFCDILRVVMQTGVTMSMSPNQADAVEWQTWGDVSKECEENPNRVIDVLVSRAHHCSKDPETFGDDILQLYENARGVARFFLLNPRGSGKNLSPSRARKVCNGIERAFLFDGLVLGRLQNENDVRMHFAEAVMRNSERDADSEVPRSESDGLDYWSCVDLKEVVEGLLLSPELLPHVEQQLALVEYLFGHQAVSSSRTESDRLERLRSGLLLLVEVSPEQRLTFVDLRANPALLSESLVRQPPCLTPLF
jgi:hypothetical protein